MPGHQFGEQATACVDNHGHTLGEQQLQDGGYLTIRQVEIQDGAIKRLRFCKSKGLVHRRDV